MSHIDDGAIHAYLDGALDAYPAVEAAKIREHLESCDDCACRLDEERAIRGEAEAILAMSAPIVQMPPLEDLRVLAARRKGASQARGLSRMNRWSWAASVVLALGTGWMLRGGIPESVSLPAVQEKAVQPSMGTPAVGEEDDAAADLDLSEPAPLETQAGRGTAVAPPEEEVAEEPAQPLAAAPPAAQERAEPVPSTSRMRQAEERPSLVRTDQAARAQRSTVEAMAAPLADVVQLESRVVQDLSRELLFRSEQGAVQKFSQSLGDFGSLVVPGLSVVDVSWMEDARVAGIVRIRQVMENGDTLEIMHMPAGSDPSDLGRLPTPSRTELVAPVGGGWIVMRADAHRDRLEEYLRRMIGG